ncbi:protein disulfide isomerase-like [Ancistrocladus abbreviatus]
MPTLKPTSEFVHITLILLLLLTYFLSINASTPNNEETAIEQEDDLEGIEELIAVDEQEEQLQQREPGSSSSTDEAKVLTKAQRIVPQLNNDNTMKILNENKFVLVLGYAPWCPRSAELMPQFAEAANLLRDLGSPLLMAKLDCERYPKMASALEIKGYPTLLLFINGTSQPYTGGFTTEDIVTWARKKTGEPVVRLSSVSEAEEFVKKHTLFAMGLFEKFEGPEHEEFVKAAIYDNEIQFVETNSMEIAQLLFPDIKPTNLFLGLVKSEPERYIIFDGSFEMDSILQFLEYNKFPLVTTLTELNSMKVYSSPIKLQVYVFADNGDFKDLSEPLQEVARKFKSKIIFLYVDIKDENLAKPFLTLLGLEESEKTVVAAFDNKVSTKYLLESEPTPSKIQEFCSGLLEGTVSPYFKSQPIPDNTDASIQVVVGKTFDSLILSSLKNILLEVHTPWCINCDTISKLVEKLAKHFKGLENLIFAKIDASANEHPKLQVTDYPTLLFYPAADKGNPIKLSAKSSLKDWAAFIKKNVKAGGNDNKDEL